MHNNVIGKVSKLPQNRKGIREKLETFFCYIFLYVISGY